MQRALIDNGNVILEDLKKASRRIESDYISPLCNSWGYSTLHTGIRKKEIFQYVHLADIYTWYVPGTPFIEHLLYCHGLHVKSLYLQCLPHFSLVQLNLTRSKLSPERGKSRSVVAWRQGRESELDVIYFWNWIFEIDWLA